MITSKPDMKYLVVMIDTKISFMRHLSYICEEKANISVSIAQVVA